MKVQRPLHQSIQLYAAIAGNLGVCVMMGAAVAGVNWLSLLGAAVMAAAILVVLTAGLLAWCNGWK